MLPLMTTVSRAGLWVETSCRRQTELPVSSSLIRSLNSIITLNTPFLLRCHHKPEKQRRPVASWGPSVPPRTRKRKQELEAQKAEGGFKTFDIKECRKQC